MNYIKRNIASFLAFIIANIVAAINFNLLAKPINLVSGGSGGLALVFNKFFSISTSNIIAIVYILTLILSLFLLEKKTVVGIVLASIVYPTVVYLTEDISKIVDLSYLSPFLICIISGFISGVTNGTIYKYRLASGGLGVFPLILNKYLKVSISTANFVINTTIVLMGAYFYGFNMVLYAIILLYINSYVCNMIILGTAKNKVLFIRSKQEDKITQLLHEKYHINATILDSVGQNTLMIVIRNIDYVKIKKDLYRKDKDIFFTTSNCYEFEK